GEGHLTAARRTTVALSRAPVAERVGEEAIATPGQQVGEEFVGDARARNVSEIVVGDPPRSGWLVRWRSPFLARRVKRRGRIDVQVLSAEARGEQRLQSPLPARDTRPKGALRKYALAAALVAAAGLVATAVMAALPLRDPGMLFLAAV